MTDPAAIDANPSRSRSSLARAIFTGALLGAIAAGVTEIGRMFFDRNRHVVVAGRVYRSGQLDSQDLERFVHENNIKTVVNLRGRPASDWYPAQSRTTQSLGISQEDVTTSANRLPPTDEIRRLIDVLDRSEYPILLHCRQGADRTGLASAAYLLLHTDADYATARRQFSPRYGHFPIHTAACIDEFFQQYEEWLQARGSEHSPRNFRHWATQEYSPGPGKADLKWLNAPDTVETSKPIVFTMRAYNRSRETWRFTAGSRSGIHAAYYVVDGPNSLVYSGTAGFVNTSVAPGEHIDLEIPIPPQSKVGRYTITVDLAARNASFTQYGSEPLTHDWETRDPAPLRRR